MEGPPYIKTHSKSKLFIKIEINFTAVALLFTVKTVRMVENLKSKTAVQFENACLNILN